MRSVIVRLEGPLFITWVIAFVIAISAVTAPTAFGTPDPPPGQGDFRMEDYETGGIDNDNWHFRGYAFRPARDVVVTGMWGGRGLGACAAAQFTGGIWRAEVLGPPSISVSGFPDSPQPRLRLIELMGDVVFTQTLNKTAEFVAFSEDGEPKPSFSRRYPPLRSMSSRRVDHPAPVVTT